MGNGAACKKENTFSNDNDPNVNPNKLIDIARASIMNGNYNELYETFQQLKFKSRAPFGTGSQALTLGQLLEEASGGNQLGCMELLLQHMHRRQAGYPVHTAAFHGALDALELLLSAGYSPFSRNRDSQTPLHLASLSGQEEAQDCIALLGLFGKKVLGAKDADGNTALHLAAMQGNIPACFMLLEMGAKRRSRNEQGLTAAELAGVSGHRECAEVLEASYPSLKYYSEAKHGGPQVSQERIMQIWERFFENALGHFLSDDFAEDKSTSRSSVVSTHLPDTDGWKRLDSKDSSPGSKDGSPDSMDGFSAKGLSHSLQNFKVEDSWELYWDEENQSYYYYNVITDESQWYQEEMPSEDLVPETLPENSWELHYDEEHQHYYWFHIESGESVWAEDSDNLAEEAQSKATEKRSCEPEQEIIEDYYYSSDYDCYYYVDSHSGESVWVTEAPKCTPTTRSEKGHHSNFIGDPQWSPHDWVEEWDEENQMLYYVNYFKGLSQWSLPSDVTDDKVWARYRDPYSHTEYFWNKSTGETL